VLIIVKELCSNISNVNIFKWCHALVVVCSLVKFAKVSLTTLSRVNKFLLLRCIIIEYILKSFIVCRPIELRLLDYGNGGLELISLNVTILTRIYVIKITWLVSGSVANERIQV
jgi:hypothetical protein